MGATVYDYCYPVDPSNPAAPVGLRSCAAPLYRYGGTGPYGDVACSMGPGASGGPWLYGTDGWGMGYIVGINSQIIPGYDLVFSPWFSQNALNLYGALRNV